MGKIKKFKLPRLRAASRGDMFDRAFWDEFYWQEDASARRSMRPMHREQEEEREVTVTIRDTRTGEEWEFVGVRMVYEGKKGLAS